MLNDVAPMLNKDTTVLNVDTKGSQMLNHLTLVNPLYVLNDGATKTIDLKFNKWS